MKTVAIVGAGGIAAQHAAALCELPDAWSITHVCDLNPEAAERLAAASGAAVAPLEQVLADPAVDVIDICLPPALHVPVSIQALEAGKHVICEKPIAGSIAECRRLGEAEAASGRRLFPVFQYRYGPAFRRLRALAGAGHLGAPRVAALETHWSRNAAYYANPWRGTWAYEMGGACLSHAIHIHDLLAMLCGRVTRVSALVDTLINPIETEDCAAILMQTESGCLATSSITLGAARDESRLRVVFENATIESARAPYTPGQAEWTVVAREPSLQSALDAIAGMDGDDGFKGYFADVAAALRGEDNTAVTLADGMASIELVTAIYKAARTQSVVGLPLAQGDPFFAGWVGQT